MRIVDECETAQVSRYAQKVYNWMAKLSSE